MAKKILVGNDVTEKLLKGTAKLADAVRVTMGARGRNVLIDGNFGSLPHITKDGVTVAKSITLTDTVENSACTLIKQVAMQTNSKVGDGTTTSIVLADAIMRYGGAEILESYANPVMMKRGMDYALSYVLNELEKYKITDLTPSLLNDVARISSNGDPYIAKMVTEIFEQVGVSGNVIVQASPTETKTVYEKVEGCHFERGINNIYYANQTNNTCELDNPLILISDYTINNTNVLKPALEIALAENTSIVIVCDEIDIAVEEFLVKNKLAGNIKVCVVKAPEFGDRRVDFLQDLAILTGGRFLSKSLGEQLSDIKLTDFGKCEKFKSNVEETFIIGGKSNTQDYLDNIKKLEITIKESSFEDIIEYTKLRLAKFIGGVVLVKVGGNSDVEKIELKDRVEDAVNAVKSALINGIIPGGGVPLLRIGYANPTKLPRMDQDVRLGFNAVLKAIKIPSRSILDNAGYGEEDETLLVSKNKNIIFNIESGKFEDFLKAGVIDPLLVTQTALTNAISIAGTLLTTSCTVTYEQDSTPDNPL